MESFDNTKREEFSTIASPRQSKWDCFGFSKKKNIVSISPKQVKNLEGRQKQIEAFVNMGAKFPEDVKSQYKDVEYEGVTKIVKLTDKTPKGSEKIKGFFKSESIQHIINGTSRKETESRRSPFFKKNKTHVVSENEWKTHS